MWVLFVEVVAGMPLFRLTIAKLEAMPGEGALAIFAKDIGILLRLRLPTHCVDQAMAAFG